MLKRILVAAVKQVIRAVNRLGWQRQCYVCGKTFARFSRYRSGSRRQPDFQKKLDYAGSDVDHFGCMYCGAHDRERHLFMFFDALGLWERITSAHVLHFAPEQNLSPKIMSHAPALYVKADFYPTDDSVRKMDATDIPFADEAFDVLVANHVLEHIPDYRKALSEFYRVLKPNGLAILQTPYSRLLKANFEDDGITGDAARWFFYGQEDHVRVFGEEAFFRALEDAGFKLRIQRHDAYFDAATTVRYGVPAREDLVMLEK